MASSNGSRSTSPTTALAHAAILLLLLAVGEAKRVLFVAVAGWTPTMYMAASAAEMLRLSEGEHSVRFVAYANTQPVIQPYLDPSQVHYYGFKSSWTDNPRRKAQLMHAMGESNFQGIPDVLLERTARACRVLLELELESA